MEKDKLESLIKKLPKLNEARMVTKGYCVWAAWTMDVNPAVAQTLLDYGGMYITQERRQSLWFFFTTDVFLALARLEVWARLNPVPVFVQVFPANLLHGFKLEVSISIDDALAGQEATIPDEFEVWIHPKVQETANAIPGISFVEAPISGRNLANMDWKLLQADPRLPYQSSLGWYMIIKPLGNPLDKAFQAGWRHFFGHIEKILKKIKLQYIIHDFFLMFPLENLRVLRQFCREYLIMVRRVKENEAESYWPCVLSAVNRKGLNFNNELPKKLALDWDQLMPDFPHVSYRTAFLMGEGFKINDVRFSVDQTSVDDWCNISLSEDQEQEGGSLQIELPTRLIMGKYQPCFYCGLRGHAVNMCPSRQLLDIKHDVWDELARLDFDTLNRGMSEIDEVLAGNPEEGVSMLLEGKGVAGLLVQAIYAINSPVQLRMARVVWRSLGKDYPKALHQLGPQTGDYLWKALDALYNGEVMQVDRILNQAMIKSPQGYQPRTLLGFNALEKDDPQRALSHWREAESLSNNVFQQAYHMFLQARVAELEGKYQNAMNMYKQVVRLTPMWLDAVYRQGVCLVKMGFAEQAMSFFENLIQDDPHMFNRVLIDPELERGHLHLLASFYNLWVQAETKAVEEKRGFEDLKNEVAKWFPDDHPFSEETSSRLESLARLGEIKNFVAFNQLVQGKKILKDDLQIRVEEESLKLRANFEKLMERLRTIRSEASWFPFPRLLVEFNRDFNYCAKHINWAFRQHFHFPETFRKAQNIGETLEKRLKNLENRLKSLKIIRDATLFMLILGKTFFWLELGGLLLTMILLPIVLFYGQKMGYEWASGLLYRQKWEMQKGLIIILSVAALAMAAFRTAIVFEKKREKMFQMDKGKVRVAG